jgi:hypothetical protein
LQFKAGSEQKHETLPKKKKTKKNLGGMVQVVESHQTQGPEFKYQKAEKARKKVNFLHFLINVHIYEIQCNILIHIFNVK